MVQAEKQEDKNNMCGVQISESIWSESPDDIFSSGM